MIRKKEAGLRKEKKKKEKKVDVPDKAVIETEICCTKGQ